MDHDDNSLPVVLSADLATSGRDADLPTLVATAGPNARFAYEEFFHARIRNPNTRKAYQHAVHKFLIAARRAELELQQITPSFVGKYFDSIPVGLATKKLHLSALRNFFDEMVVRHVVVLNPALSVRTERYQAIEGRTPEFTVRQVKHLFASLDTSHVVGLRDRAIIAVLVYTAARVGAVAKLRQQDFYDSGEQHCFRFLDKGGKEREIPARHDLRRYLLDYKDAAGMQNEEPKHPLFVSAIGRTKRLSTYPMTADAIGYMLKRRLRDAGLPTRFSPHSFRVTTITDLLEQGVPLDDVQDLAGHSDPRTTRLYDRRNRKVKRNTVERISI